MKRILHVVIFTFAVSVLLLENSFAQIAQIINVGQNNGTTSNAYAPLSVTVNPGDSAAINDPKENKFEFSANPNPFEDQLSMNINIGDKNVTEVKIYDLIGKEVASVNLSGKTGFHSYRVDTSNLKAGIYFCTVYSANGILETRKIFRRN